MGNRGSAPLILNKIRSAVYAAASIVLTAGAGQATCSEDSVSLRGNFGEAQFTVSVADTNAERAQGLMYVEKMANSQGMLFVYGRPQRVSFWMRNTLISLDMVFVDDTGVVANIHSMAQPLDETPIFGGDDIQYVLEIKGGMAQRLGLEAGDQMQHPAFGRDSVWPCEAD